MKTEKYLIIRSSYTEDNVTLSTVAKKSIEDGKVISAFEVDVDGQKIFYEGNPAILLALHRTVKAALEGLERDMERLAQGE